MEKKGAIISEDGKYRYRLWRIIDETNTKPGIAFIGLNPSKADAYNDDATIRRCIDFAKRWGYGHMFMYNLFAFRSTQRAGLLIADDPIGPENDKHLEDIVKMGYDVVLCWGISGTLNGRGAQIAKMFPLAKCFGVTKNGQPRHPVRLAKITQLQPYVLSKGPDTLGEPVVSDKIINVLGVPTVD